MSLIDETAVSAAGEAVLTRPHRRTLTSRLSVGHVLMIVAGLLAAVTNFALLRAGDASFRAAVAANDLLPGQALTSDALTFTDVEVGDDVANSLIGPHDGDELVGSVLVNHIAAGELITRTDLRAPAAASGLRAMSVPLDAAHAVGGALRPGDRVDVIEVRDGIARYIAVSVEVLAVSDQSAGAIGGLGAYSVTVAVDADTALALAAAVNAGSLELVRSTGSDEAAVGATSRPRGSSDGAPEG
ncbi:MAG: Flp pilus assembly protein CpaB [Actinomycetota bacterium]|nr:Flp pilus assembly protein CpaB [Actinomycetota bacterium]